MAIKKQQQVSTARGKGSGGFGRLLFRPFSSSISPSPSPEPELIGTIYEKSSWANLDDFSDNTATATPSISGDKIQLTGGNGTFTNSIDLLRYTCLEKWKFTARVTLLSTPASTTFGWGFGIRSYNTTGVRNTVCRYITANTASSGRLFINSGASDALAASTSAPDIVPPVLNHEYQLTIELDRYNMSFTVEDLTVGGSVTLNYTFESDGASGPALHNTGRFAMFSFGGTHRLEYLKVESAEYKNPKYMLIGDSKSKGYRASDFDLRFGSLLAANYDEFAVNAGGSDKMDEVTLRLDEITNLCKPEVAILSIGSNDKRQGQGDSSVLTEYDALVSAMTSAGIRVFHIGPIRESSLALEFMYTHIAATYAAADIVDPGSPGLDGDGVHPNDAGHAAISTAIISSGKL